MFSFSRSQREREEKDECCWHCELFYFQLDFIYSVEEKKPKKCEVSNACHYLASHDVMLGTHYGSGIKWFLSSMGPHTKQEPFYSAHLNSANTRRLRPEHFVQ